MERDPAGRKGRLNIYCLLRPEAAIRKRARKKRWAKPDIREAYSMTFVGAGKQRRRHRQAESLGGLEID
jgi:hypothetical protein